MTGVLSHAGKGLTSVGQDAEIRHVDPYKDSGHQGLGELPQFAMLGVFYHISIPGQQLCPCLQRRRQLEAPHLGFLWTLHVVDCNLWPLAIFNRS